MLEDELHKLIGLINFEIKRKKLTRKKIAADLNLTQATMTRILRLENGSFDTLLKIVKYLDSYNEKIS